MEKKNMTLTYETIENLYVSPAVKREIWQTLKILKEIQKVMGGEPKRVFIEPVSIRKVNVQILGKAG